MSPSSCRPEQDPRQVCEEGLRGRVVTYTTEAHGGQEGLCAGGLPRHRGARNIINDIRFEGLTVLADKKLRSKMKLKEKQFYHLWGKAGKLDNDVLQSDVRAIERAVQDQGCVYARSPRCAASR